MTAPAQSIAVAVAGAVAQLVLASSPGAITTTDNGYPGYDYGYEPVSTGQTTVVNTSATTGPGTVTSAAPTGVVSAVMNQSFAGDPVAITATAPVGSRSSSAVVAGPVAFQAYSTAAPQGAVAASSVVPVDVALAGAVAQATVVAPAGSLAVSSGTTIQMPQGVAASTVLTAPAGSVAVTTTPSAGNATASVPGATAAAVLAAPAGTVQASVVGGIPGAVATAVLTAPVGAVRGYVVDRAPAALTLSLPSPTVTTQPGVLVFQVVNAVPGSSVSLFLDGALVKTSTASGDGTVSGNLGITAVSTGAHSLRAGATQTLPTQSTYNTQSFTVTAAPAPAPVAPTFTVPPRTTPAVGVRRWIFQADDGSYDYTLPRNPERSSPVYGEWTYSSEATADGNRFIEWEGAFAPTTWVFTGRVFTKEEYDALVNWTQISERFYITDHYGHRFRVKVSRLSTTRVRDRARPWHHTYEVSCWVLAGDGVLV